MIVFLKKAKWSNVTKKFNDNNNLNTDGVVHLSNNLISVKPFTLK
jgi:hypothetical protein